MSKDRKQLKQELKKALGKYEEVRQRAIEHQPGEPERYLVRNTWERLLLGLLPLPTIVGLIAAQIKGYTSTADTTAVIVIGCIAGLLGFLLASDRTGKYLPLRTTKALKILQEKTAELNQVCFLAEEERWRLAPLLAKFAKLEETITGDRLGTYRLHEYIVDGKPIFYVRARIWSKGIIPWNKEKYIISQTGYERLEKEVAKAWTEKHCLDDEAELLRKFRTHCFAAENTINNEDAVS